MTTKGQKNHYNVKFLKGYGHSISVKNSKIILKDCHDPFSEPEKEEWFVKNMPYEKIVLSGKGYISTEAMSVLSSHNRHVILMDTYGNPVTFLEPVRSSLTASKSSVPVMMGIRWSDNITSILCSAIIFNADRPFSAVKMV